MPWQDDYLAALQARDQREHASKAVIDAYTKLADRASQAPKPRAVAMEKTGSSDRARGMVAAVTGGVVGGRGRNSPGAGGGGGGGGGGGPGSALASMQADLTEAQAARAELAGQVSRLGGEAERARTKARHERETVRELQTERAALAAKLRDRDEELRGKAKLLDDVQNDAVTLNLQLNVLEERNARLRAENEELVARWMARMGEEADRMNLESKFT